MEDLCNGLGYLDCHCGGDLCICMNNGEIPCPGCDACDPRDDFEADDEDNETRAQRGEPE